MYLIEMLIQIKMWIIQSQDHRSTKCKCKMKQCHWLEYILIYCTHTLQKKVHRQHMWALCLFVRSKNFQSLMFVPKPDRTEKVGVDLIFASNKKTILQRASTTNNGNERLHTFFIIFILQANILIFFMAFLWFKFQMCHF